MENDGESCATVVSLQLLLGQAEDEMLRSKMKMWDGEGSARAERKRVVKDFSTEKCSVKRDLCATL